MEIKVRCICVQKLGTGEPSTHFDRKSKPAEFLCIFENVDKGDKGNRLHGQMSLVSDGPLTVDAVYTLTVGGNESVAN